MANRLYASATGCSDIISVTVSDSHNAPTSTATVRCLSTNRNVGDSINIDLGYSGNHGDVFYGYVKSVQTSEFPRLVEITCANVMIRAIDYFIVSSNPNTPYEASNIDASDLVQDLMELAGLTDYSAVNSNFVFATEGTPLQVNLVSSYDFSKMVADIIAWHLYADKNGTVHFKERPPFPDAGASVATLNNSNLINVTYYESDRDLRNRVVVYGSEGVYAEASAESPYLPNGFYKSVAVAAPTIITNQGAAQDAADHNLALLNRLTIGGTATIIGNHEIDCREHVTVNKSDMGMSGKFYVYGVEHDWSKDGYKTTLELRK